LDYKALSLFFRLSELLRLSKGPVYPNKLGKLFTEMLF